MEKMGLTKKKLQRKPRRRTQRKKLLLPSDSPMDMAEARREIVNALHIHRSCSRHHHCYKSQENTNAIASSASSSSSQLHYPLAESVRLPEPIWSTTEPNSSAEIEEQEQEVIVLDWPESNYVSSSSYAWWLGFLSSLDSNIGANHHQILRTSEELSEVITDNNNNIMNNNENENENEQNPSQDFVGSYHEWFSSITSGSEDINVM